MTLSSDPTPPGTPEPDIPAQPTPQPEIDPSDTPDELPPLEPEAETKVIPALWRRLKSN